MRRSGFGGLIMILIFAYAGGAQEVKQTAHVVPAKGRDIAKWPVAQQQMQVGAQRAMDWLRRANKPDGRFVYGFLPALCVPMEGDYYVHQAGAAFALARAGRYFNDDASTAIARQALLTLLLETAVDPQDRQQRCTAAPPQVLNRLAGNGALLRAIHELAAPGKDLLEQGEQLANYLRHQQQSDGTLQLAGSTADSEEAWQTSGLALHGIIRSHQHRPAAWKPALLAAARDHYLAQWQKAHNLPLAVRHTPAYAEAYVLTKDRAFAEAVFAMNDWLCGLQYTQAEPLNKHWEGGFPPWENGQAQRVAPDIRSSACAVSLAEACRVARAAGDLPRYQRYRRALEPCLLYLLTLQYTPARTRHFVEDFRPAVLGAFHASHQDGNLRLDYTEQPLTALVSYLEHVAE
jgi:hypothetical protein